MDLRKATVKDYDFHWWSGVVTPLYPLHESTRQLKKIKIKIKITKIRKMTT